MATQLASATDQLWDRWPYLSHEQRLKQFRELHTGEKADFFLALAEDRESGGLHAAHTQLIAARKRVSAREVHPHQPVGTAPSARRFGQGIVIPARSQLIETLADCLGR